MALLKNTIINGNLKVNSDATVNGNVSSKGLNIKDKLLYIPTSVSSLVTIDGDLQTNGLLSADDGINCNGNLTIEKDGMPAYPKCITYITLIKGQKLTLQTPIVVAYNAYLLDDIYVTIHANGFGRILSHSALSATTSSGIIEVKFPTQNQSTSPAAYTITSGKVNHTLSGNVTTVVASPSITAGLTLSIVLEYSPYYTEISIT